MIQRFWNYMERILNEARDQFYEAHDKIEDTDIREDLLEAFTKYEIIHGIIMTMCSYKEWYGKENDDKN